MTDTLLALADGSLYEGTAFGWEGETQGELVFNTSITGYQEILTDPSYHGQIVVMTAPMIGNYGVNEEDIEAATPQVAGFIVKEYCPIPSNFRATSSLGDYLARAKIVSGSAFPTRNIVRHIRSRGAQPAFLSSLETNRDLLIEKARAIPVMVDQDLATVVTCQQPYSIPAKGKTRFRLAALDYGVKRNILRELAQRGCDIAVLPAKTSAEEILKGGYDGLVLSNGPGDPAAVGYAIENLKKLTGHIPILAICLGHQLLALSFGAETFKLKFGHRGGNQPVKDLESARVFMTAQNHGFAVSPENFPKELEVTQINLNDKTVEGFRHRELPIFSVQYHPEAGPGPNDAKFLFDRFLEWCHSSDPRLKHSGMTGTLSFPRKRESHCVNNLKKVLVIGSGPIQIGQACEFDYSGTQAIKALREEGLKTVLVNSNPATIMTDPDFADAVYVEPLTVESLTLIIAKERPDALLPTVGGQTALNLAIGLEEAGVLKKFGIRLIGADIAAIRKAEDREAFKKAMTRIGLKVPPSAFAYSVEQASEIASQIGFPVVIRPAFTLGGSGGGIVQDEGELMELAERGLALSPIHQILVEQSVMGWKEFELEVMRDRLDNVVIVCSIENMDPMGVHTGDSITVAPIQTLTDREYQEMRDAAIRAIREIGVEAGGCNVQFAVNPHTGEQVMIEINPRVSRSSALASKATGFPIAKIAAKLACGYTLDELPNDITKKTPASFEPTLDYVVTKIPRFTFEKFAAAPNTLTTQMKSVGEVMAIGRTFKESLLKAIRSMEQDCYGLEMPPIYREEFLLEDLGKVRAQRLWQIAEALRQGVDIEKIYSMTRIDRWFLRQIEEIVQEEQALAVTRLSQLQPSQMRHAKEMGFSDRRMAQLLKTEEGTLRNLRREMGIRPVYKTVDTCAAEFEAFTPYLYSTYEPEDEFPRSAKKKVMILGSGPNRIGQGIEFDYCCVHAALAFRDLGFETIMVNCNPETVSTDYDISDRLYFEPLTFEDVMNIVEKEKPDGVVIQFGGQTPLKLALSLFEANVPIWGTTPQQIDRAEDREQFKALIDQLKLKQPRSGMASDLEEAKNVAGVIGYPVLVRPSYVLGGAAMGIVSDASQLQHFLENAKKVSPRHPVLIDQFLQEAVEVDVDAVCDGTQVVIAGVMEHIEEAGIHSGDSSCSLPPQNLSAAIVGEIERQTRLLALSLETRGLINIQFAVQKDTVFVLEVNPRGSRTVPFVSKATGIAWAKVAARVLAGEKLGSHCEHVRFAQCKLRETIPRPHWVAVKSPVFPFIKFPGTDTLLSPEMRSTGEVMGLAPDFAAAYAKAQRAAGQKLPKAPATVFLSVCDELKSRMVAIARELDRLGFDIVATRGTSRRLKEAGITTTPINKLKEGPPHIVALLQQSQVALVINIVETRQQIADSFVIRRTALEQGIPYYNHLSQLDSVLKALACLKNEAWLEPMSL